ncbi:MAG TPA: phytanoyl-CoA dioxygenase family protein [Pyrinomonadaceae bacterium]|nr:phytanoyl-CoA dioxygenase family protein [Pyrinomonadaceae bacterium]
MIPVLTHKQLNDYEEVGFLQSIPILSPAEVADFRAAIEETCRALGGRVTRLDAPHLFFRWAWDLSTHPHVLDCMEQLIGPNILLKSTRLFYKFGNSSSFVSWHQDGITEALKEAYIPAIWLGLTPATAENGCLRVVPRSHRLGLIPHADRPHPDNLTTQGATAQISIDAPQDVVMEAGEMSLHHPLVLHASNPNCSDESRIGFSAIYSTPALTASRSAVAWVRGDGPRDRFQIVEKPPLRTIQNAAVAYLKADNQILFAQ